MAGARRAAGQRPYCTLAWQEIPSGGAAVKVCMFHLMPYRDLPSDFVTRYDSAFIDPVWFDVADSDKVGEYYNATLDELLYAAKAGFHGVCPNPHHQNRVVFMSHPSPLRAALAT